MVKRLANPKPGLTMRIARKLSGTNSSLHIPISLASKRRFVSDEDHQKPSYLGNLLVDEAGRQLIGPAGAVKLTRIEWDILTYLLDNAGRVLTREQMLSRVWGPAYKDANSLLHDAISRLRQRFEAAGMATSPLETRHGMGYRLRTPNELID